MLFCGKYYFSFCYNFKLSCRTQKKAALLEQPFTMDSLIDIFGFCRVIDYGCRYNFKVILIELVEFAC